jgi:hypothetical protein
MSATTKRTNSVLNEIEFLKNSLNTKIELRNKYKKEYISSGNENTGVLLDKINETIQIINKGILTLQNKYLINSENITFVKLDKNTYKVQTPFYCFNFTAKFSKYRNNIQFHIESNSIANNNWFVKNINDAKQQIIEYIKKDEIFDVWEK